MLDDMVSFIKFLLSIVELRALSFLAANALVVASAFPSSLSSSQLFVTKKYITYLDTREANNLP